MTLTIGSLCSGYGGLDAGVQMVLDADVAWHSDIDPGACKILAHHWPDVPNLGDMTTVDWSQVEPVDIITGGTPCQDLSHAGKRAGMRAGTRSGLWASMCDAIQIIRPSLVVWENVRGALSADADSALEPCPGCVGDGDDGPVLRALGRVLGDLAELGYDSRVHGLRAADVGAPHGRFRIFVVATDTRCGGRQWGCVGGATPDTAHIGHQRGGQSRDGWAGPEDSGSVAPDTAGDGRGEGWPEPAGQFGRSDAAERGGASAADAEVAERRGPKQQDMGTSTGPAAEPRERLGAATDWGVYGPAIERWGSVLGRCAPAPTELGRTGNPRLSPRFVEWMQGLPAGHVTDVPGLSRNEQLKALGNGVVPQQCAAALRVLLNAEAVAV